MMRRFRSYPTIGGRRGGIPADCVEVQYLRSTGTQYLNIPFHAGSGFRIEYVFKYENIGVRGLQGFSSFSADYWGVNANGYYELGAASSCSAGGVDTIVWAWDSSTKFSLTVNGSRVLTRNASIVRVNDDLQINRLQGLSAIKASMYSVKCYDSNGCLKYDLVPVRRVESGVSVGYMCDRLTGELYGNQGTGAFVVGPDKGAWTNPYVTDGLVAMWDGEWNAGGGVHDPAATVWKDLIGSNNMTLTSAGSFDENSLVSLGYTNNLYAASFVGNITPQYTIEVVVRKDGGASSPRITAEIGFPTLYFGTNSTNVGIYGQGLDSGLCSTSEGINNVSVTYDGSVVQGWFNGNRGNSYTTVQPPTSVSTATLGNRTSGGRGLDGHIYCLRIYNRALTQSEVVSNALTDRERFGIN